ncbi:hypothetical protein [Cohnella sp. GbtcB17]|uniref:hypothetical protein n=1 Tax=Cohnella sp. GbtcB17 TaxID=2824762 RepID=UPI0034D55ECB
MLEQRDLAAPAYRVRRLCLGSRLPHRPADELGGDLHARPQPLVLAGGVRRAPDQLPLEQQADGIGRLRQVQLRITQDEIRLGEGHPMIRVASQDKQGRSRVVREARVQLRFVGRDITRLFVAWQADRGDGAAILKLAQPGKTALARGFDDLAGRQVASRLEQREQIRRTVGLARLRRQARLHLRQRFLGYRLAGLVPAEQIAGQLLIDL